MLLNLELFTVLFYAKNNLLTINEKNPFCNIFIAKRIFINKLIFKCRMNYLEN